MREEEGVEGMEGWEGENGEEEEEGESQEEEHDEEEKGEEKGKEKVKQIQQPMYYYYYVKAANTEEEGGKEEDIEGDVVVKEDEDGRNGINTGGGGETDEAENNENKREECERPLGEQALQSFLRASFYAVQKPPVGFDGRLYPLKWLPEVTFDDVLEYVRSNLGREITGSRVARALSQVLPEMRLGAGKGKTGKKLRMTLYHRETGILSVMIMLRYKMLPPGKSRPLYIPRLLADREILKKGEELAKELKREREEKRKKRAEDTAKSWEQGIVVKRTRNYRPRKEKGGGEGGEGTEGTEGEKEKKKRKPRGKLEGTEGEKEKKNGTPRGKLEGTEGTEGEKEEKKRKPRGKLEGTEGTEGEKEKKKRTPRGKLAGTEGTEGEKEKKKRTPRGKLEGTEGTEGENEKGKRMPRRKLGVEDAERKGMEKKKPRPRRRFDRDVRIGVPETPLVEFLRASFYYIGPPTPTTPTDYLPEVTFQDISEYVHRNFAEKVDNIVLYSAVRAAFYLKVSENTQVSLCPPMWSEEKKEFACGPGVSVCLLRYMNLPSDKIRPIYVRPDRPGEILEGAALTPIDDVVCTTRKLNEGARISQLRSYVHDVAETQVPPLQPSNEPARLHGSEPARVPLPSLQPHARPWAPTPAIKAQIPEKTSAPASRPPPAAVEMKSRLNRLRFVKSETAKSSTKIPLKAAVSPPEKATEDSGRDMPFENWGFSGTEYSNSDASLSEYDSDTPDFLMAGRRQPRSRRTARRPTPPHPFSESKQQSEKSSVREHSNHVKSKKPSDSKKSELPQHPFSITTRSKTVKPSTNGTPSRADGPKPPKSAKFGSAQSQSQSQSHSLGPNPLPTTDSDQTKRFAPSKREGGPNPHTPFSQPEISKPSSGIHSSNIPVVKDVPIIMLPPKTHMPKPISTIESQHSPSKAVSPHPPTAAVNVRRDPIPQFRTPPKRSRKPPMATTTTSPADMQKSTRSSTSTGAQPPIESDDLPPLIRSFWDDPPPPLPPPVPPKPNDESRGSLFTTATAGVEQNDKPKFRQPPRNARKSTAGEENPPLPPIPNMNPLVNADGQFVCYMYYPPTHEISGGSKEEDTQPPTQAGMYVPMVMEKPPELGSVDKTLPKTRETRAGNRDRDRLLSFLRQEFVVTKRGDPQNPMDELPEVELADLCQWVHQHYDPHLDTDEITWAVCEFAGVDSLGKMVSEMNRVRWSPASEVPGLGTTALHVCNLRWRRLPPGKVRPLYLLPAHIHELEELARARQSVKEEPEQENVSFAAHTAEAEEVFEPKYEAPREYVDGWAERQEFDRGRQLFEYLFHDTEGNVPTEAKSEENAPAWLVSPLARKRPYKQVEGDWAEGASSDESLGSEQAQSWFLSPQDRKRPRIQQPPPLPPTTHPYPNTRAPKAHVSSPPRRPAPPSHSAQSQEFLFLQAAAKGNVKPRLGSMSPAYDKQGP